MTLFHAALAGTLAGLAWGAMPAGAADIVQLGVPIDCDMAATCSIQNYVDVDRGAGAQDYHCGTLTYNGHQGTDFQLVDLATMRRGIVVRAAAEGTVRNARDGVPDRGFDYWQRHGSEANALGNAVAIRHADGSETLYGHLRQGSVIVHPGDRVAAGQPIGFVGFSGKTQFPHLHFQFMRAGNPVDPFTGMAPSTAGCRAAGQAAWTPAAMAQLAYRPAVLVCGGFALAVPERQAIQDTCPTLATAATDSSALVLFAEIAGVQVGDRLRLAIMLPDGNPLIDNAIAIDKARARQFRYVGQKRPGRSWTAGRYTARIELRRTDRDTDRMVIGASLALDMR